MQPYFFPYIGYFQLINAVDKWIVFDVVQYMRHHWINRNRILHPSLGWQYIVVPVAKYHRESLIKDILIVDTSMWRSRIIAQLEHYHKKAPFFRETVNFIRDCFSSIDTTEKQISKLNTFFLKKTCERLSIKFDYEICSEMRLKLFDVTEPGEWALTISEQMGANEYINPIGGNGIFHSSKFEEKKIVLKFLTSKSITYEQRGYEFVPDLSIIDLMMWNSEADIKIMLNEYDIIKP